MSDGNPARRRRRTIGDERLTRSVRVALSVDLADRLEALSDRYGVATATVARAAIEAGLPAAIERLRRAEQRRQRREREGPLGAAGDDT